MCVCIVLRLVLDTVLALNMVIVFLSLVHLFLEVGTGQCDLWQSL